MLKASLINKNVISFSIELVENIPDDLLLPIDGRPRLPLSAGFHILLDQAKHSVEVVSPVWALNPWDLETTPSTAKEVQSQSGKCDLIYLIFLQPLNKLAAFPEGGL